MRYFSPVLAVQPLLYLNTVEDREALVAYAENAGLDFDASEIDGERLSNAVVDEAIRCIFVDPAGPGWLIQQSFCDGWTVEMVPPLPVPELKQW